MVGVKYIASVSFGKDSLAMLLRLLEEDYPLDAVVFYDTGMEFDAIYRVRDKVAPLLSTHDIAFVELHPNESFLYSMLERKVIHRKKSGFHYGYGWCGGSCRWGTTAKLAAIKNYKKSLRDEVIDYVGIAVDEPQRFDKAKAGGKLLPLVEWNMTEADCLSYCKDRGWNWTESGVDLYDVLDRVSCWCCRNKNLKELRNIYKFLPQYWDKLKDLQRQIPEPMKGVDKSVFDLERRFEIEKQFLADGKSISSKEFFDAISGVPKVGDSDFLLERR